MPFKSAGSGPKSLRYFEARFDSDCEHCGLPIYEGDDVAFIDDDIACVSCCYDYDEGN